MTNTVGIKTFSQCSKDSWLKLRQKSCKCGRKIRPENYVRKYDIKEILFATKKSGIAEQKIFIFHFHLLCKNNERFLFSISFHDFNCQTFIQQRALTFLLPLPCSWFDVVKHANAMRRNQLFLPATRSLAFFSFSPTSYFISKMSFVVLQKTRWGYK